MPVPHYQIRGWSTRVPTNPSRRHMTRCANTSMSTMPSDRTVRLHAAPRMRCTSTSSHFPWPLNPPQRFHLTNLGKLFKQTGPALRETRSVEARERGAALLRPFSCKLRQDARLARISVGRRQFVKARDFDSRIHRFESCRPSHFFNDLHAMLRNVFAERSALTASDRRFLLYVFARGARS